MDIEVIKAKIAEFKAKGCEVLDMDMIKMPEQIEGIRAAAKINNACLDLIAQKIKAGMTTEEIDALAYDFITKSGGIPACLGFYGFPKSICTSVNDQVCHGIPDKTVLKSGDIVNVDVTTIYNGYYADASRMFMIGKVSKPNQDLVAITKECMRRGVEACKPWAFIGDIGAAIAPFAHKHGYSVVTEFGGHGVGVDFHEEPFVCHDSKKNTGMLMVPGMVFTVEPMINAGRRDVFIDASNDWTVYTQDGSMSAQWENTVLVTDTGVEVLAW